MQKLLSLAAFAVAFAVLSFSGAVAAPQNKSVMPDGSYKVADWDDRVCCHKNGNDFWTTWRRCEKFGGDRVKNGRCRDNWDDRWDNRWWQWNGDWDRRICCKRGNHDWWSTARECRQQYGYEADRDDCRDDRDNRDWDSSWDSRWRNWNGDWDRRICCEKDDRNWWSTPRDCRKRGGWMTRDRECRDNGRDDWNSNWDERWRNWNGDWDERICCKKGDRDWWSTRRDCRDRGGWETRRYECRED